MLGPQIGFGPVFLQKPLTKFKRCDEFHTQPCDVAPTDQCCSVIPCTYCLLLISYGSEFYGTATFNETAWEGDVGGLGVRLYWQRNEYNECKFVVEVNGTVVERVPCSDGKCRDASGSVVLSDGSELHWDRREQRPLPYVKSQDGCTDHFCGNCECTCRELCVRIDSAIATLYLDEYLTDCEGPVWFGDLLHDAENLYIELQLVRDEYSGGCLLEGSINGSLLTPEVIDDCSNISVTFATPFGDLIVTCKVCECEPDGCTAGCCFPYEENFPCGYPEELGRRLKVIRWTLSAPNCPELDGLTGTLSPETTCPHSSIGPCGNCVCYVNDAHGTTAILGTAYVDNGDSCGATPCGFVSICFNITCNPRESSAEGISIDDCCSRIKLLVLVQGSTNVIGGNPVDFTRPNECVDAGDGLVNFIGCAGNPGQTLLYLDPVLCSCQDELNDFEVVYDLSQLEFGCSEFFEEGPCQYQCRDCIPINCSLEGATIVLTQGEP